MPFIWNAIWSSNYELWRSYPVRAWLSNEEVLVHVCYAVIGNIDASSTLKSNSLELKCPSLSRNTMCGAILVAKSRGNLQAVCPSSTAEANWMYPAIAVRYVAYCYSLMTSHFRCAFVLGCMPKKRYIVSRISSASLDGLPRGIVCCRFFSASLNSCSSNVGYASWPSRVTGGFSLLTEDYNCSEHLVAGFSASKSVRGSFSSQLLSMREDG